MAAKREKSELERYLDSAALSARIKALKKPGNWIYWVGFVFVFWNLSILGAGYCILIVLVLDLLRNWLNGSRFGWKSFAEMQSKRFEEMAPGVARRMLRKGTFDAKVGSDRRAMLESCAATTNTIMAVSARTYMAKGGGMKALNELRPIGEAAESLMNSAIYWAVTPPILLPVMTKGLSEALQEAAESLKTLHEEAERIASGYVTPTPVLSTEVTNTLESIKARKELDEGIDLSHNS